MFGYFYVLVVIFVCVFVGVNFGWDLVFFEIMSWFDGLRSWFGFKFCCVCGKLE